jgi:hypothetical protein
MVVTAWIRWEQKSVSTDMSQKHKTNVYILLTFLLRHICGVLRTIVSGLRIYCGHSGVDPTDLGDFVLKTILKMYIILIQVERNNTGKPGLAQVIISRPGKD